MARRPFPTLQLELGNQILAEDKHLPLYKVRAHWLGWAGAVGGPAAAVPAATRRRRAGALPALPIGI